MSISATTRRWRVCLAGALCTLLSTALPALGQGQGPPRIEDSQPPQTVNKVGEYSGVKPGASPYDAPKRKKNLVSWIGFQLREGGGSRVFVQLSNEVSYEQRVEDGTLAVKLENGRYRHRNVSRRLDTRYFETVLRQVTSKRVRKRRATRKRPAQSPGIELRIEFKNAADAQQATATVEKEKDGYHYLYLDFPAPAGTGSLSISEPE